MVSAILTSLVDQGLRRIVVWQCCGCHDIQQVVYDFNEVHRGTTQVFLAAQPFHAIRCQLGDADVPGGHADSFVTSITLYLRRVAVRIDRMADPHRPPIDWTTPT